MNIPVQPTIPTQTPAPPTLPAQSATPAQPVQQQKTMTAAQAAMQNFNASTASNRNQMSVLDLKSRQQKAVDDQTKRDQDAKDEPFNQLSDTLEAVQTVTGGAGNAIGQLPIYRGLGIAFIVLISLIWALIPTQSGYTRLQLLWLTLLGETKLTTSQYIKQSDIQPNASVTLPNQNAVTQNQPAIGVAQGPSPTQTNINLSGIDFSGLDLFGE